MKVRVTGNSSAMPDGARGVTSPCDQVTLANVVEIRQANRVSLYGRMGTARQALPGDVVGTASGSRTWKRHWANHENARGRPDSCVQPIQRWRRSTSGTGLPLIGVQTTGEASVGLYVVYLSLVGSAQRSAMVSALLGVMLASALEEYGLASLRTMRGFSGGLFWMDARVQIVMRRMGSK